MKPVNLNNILCRSVLWHPESGKALEGHTNAFAGIEPARRRSLYVITQLSVQ